MHPRRMEPANDPAPGTQAVASTQGAPDSDVAEKTILASIQDLQKKLMSIRGAGTPRDASAGGARSTGTTAVVGEERQTTPAAATATPTKPPQRTGRLIVVANRLPISVSKDENGDYSFKMSSGGLVSALVSVRDRLPFLWLGWIGKEIPAADQPLISARLLDEYRCVPVYISDALVEAYYNGMSNDVLWPLFHYEFQPGSTNRKFQYSLWERYREANVAFADAVLSVAQPDDLIWVHDYHLMLTPYYLRQKLSETTIAWFLHTPWPSSEVYRMLPASHEILRGLLSCDMVGFHTWDYARHFLSSCARTLQGVEASPSSITFRGRTTTCGVWPIGIEPDNFITMVKSEPAQMKLNELCVRFAGMRVMVAVDRLDPIKGVPHRLLGLDALFRRHPEWIGKVVMIQVAVPSRTDVDAYQALTQTVNTLIGRINAEFGTLSYTPVHYLYRSVDPSELAALYTVADAALVTSLRDGMNLVSFEYVACQSQPCANRTSPGVLVLSEFAGAAQSLAGALRCNPWNPNEVAETLHAALTLSAADRQLRHDKLYSYVSVHTAPAWALAYVSAMEVAGKRAAQARKDRAHSISRLPAPAVADRYADAGSRLIVIGYEDVVQGKGLRLGAGEVAAIQPTMKSSTTTAATAQAGVAGRALDPSSTAAATMHSPRRSAHLPAPSTTTIRVLQLLCADPRNVVVLVSSADRDFLEAAFAPVPALRIIAESGAMVRIPTMTVADETATLRIRAELEAPLTVSLDRAGGQELLRKVQHTAETTLQLEKEHPLQPPSMDTSYTQDAAASSMLIPHAGAVGAASAGRGGGDGIGGVDIRPTVIGLFDQQQQHLPHKATPVSSIVTSSSRGPVPSLPHASMKQHDRLPTTPVHSIRLRSSSMLSGSPGFAATEKAKAGRAARASSATAIDDNAKQEYRASVQQPTAQPAQPSSAPNMLTAVSTRWYATVPEAVGAQPRACRLMIKKPATRPTTTATAAAAAAGEAKAPLRAPSSGVLLERVPSSLIEEEQAAAAADAGQQHHHQVEAVWKATLRPILRYYALSTPGSVVEETANSLVWRYEGADPELAMWQAKDLQAHLESTTLAPAPLDIVVPPGAKALEVRVRGATVLNGLLHVIDDHMATARSSSGGGCITGTSAPARLPFDFLVCMTDGRDTESIAAAAAALSTLDIVDGIGGGGVEVTTAKTAIYLTRVAPPEGAHRKGGLGTAAPSSHARISSVSSIPGGDGSAAATGGSVAGTYGWYPGTVSESLRRVDFEVQGTPEARAVLGQLANITKAALMPPALVTPAPASVQPRQQQPTQHRYQSQEKQPVVDGSKSPNVVQKAMVSSSASTAASPASQPSAGQR